MLRLASDPDDTYVPYAKTNKELTDDEDKVAATATASSGALSFSGIDDTANNAYFVFFNITDSNSPTEYYAKLSSIAGSGTSNLILSYATDAPNGTSAILVKKKMIR